MFGELISPGGLNGGQLEDHLRCQEMYRSQKRVCGLVTPDIGAVKPLADSGIVHLGISRACPFRLPAGCQCGTGVHPRVW